MLVVSLELWLMFAQGLEPAVALRPGHGAVRGPVPAAGAPAPVLCGEGTYGGGGGQAVRPGRGLQHFHSYYLRAGHCRREASRQDLEYSLIAKFVKIDINSK